jgi:hypothetical protein
MTVSRSTDPQHFPAVSWPGGTPFNPVVALLEARRTMPDEHSPATGRRARLWELPSMLHCSIIGTCLTTAELRRIFVKLGIAGAADSEHELHKHGVTLAGRHDAPARLLDKALEERHRLTVRRFAAAHTEAELREKWAEALAAAEIAGGYWATLTHPASTPQLIHTAFGEVHMLSHLVGAANRADIRRLRALEQENAALADRLACQQRRLHDAAVRRDAEIHHLRTALAARPVDTPERSAVPETDMPDALIATLERRLAGEARRRAVVERQLDEARQAAAQARQAAQRDRQHAAALQAELAAVEAHLAALPAAAPAGRRCRDGMTLLYVGGRPQSVPRLKALAAGHGATLLHHDAGIEESAAMLAGLVSRADIVLFPVDCVSHAAALRVKRQCRQTGKPMVALRSAGATSFLGWLVAEPGTGSAGV